ncbi:hypothetical protein GCM10009530_47180 [Microbispora corallina]|uniref:Uncharacterized protein n=1 Tax=Microbispora corallina TaxID=83302 RepID=A0ABQ4G5D3_9ACTN|nr:hypothetical protein Mco01_52930 [Microbispora corallina]
MEPLVAEPSRFSLKSLAVRTTDVAPVDGVTVIVATGRAPMGEPTGAELSEAEGDGVDTPAAPEAEIDGSTWIHLSVPMATGAGSAEAPDDSVSVAVKAVPTAALPFAVNDTVKSCVTAAPEDGVHV